MSGSIGFNLFGASEILKRRVNFFQIFPMSKLWHGNNCQIIKDSGTTKGQPGGAREEEENNDTPSRAAEGVRSKGGGNHRCRPEQNAPGFFFYWKSLKIRSVWSECVWAVPIGCSVVPSSIAPPSGTQTITRSTCFTIKWSIGHKARDSSEPHRILLDYRVSSIKLQIWSFRNNRIKRNVTNAWKFL